MAPALWGVTLLPLSGCSGRPGPEAHAPQVSCGARVSGEPPGGWAWAAGLSLCPFLLLPCASLVPSITLNPLSSLFLISPHREPSPSPPAQDAQLQISCFPADWHALACCIHCCFCYPCSPFPRLSVRLPPARSCSRLPNTHRRSSSSLKLKNAFCSFVFNKNSVYS